jgi:glucose-1-phosphate cytidylyltransferase
LKAVILAGGLGTRISEETYLKPKPMIEIGYKPILWHIMKIYSFYGITDFVICCGYKSYVIKEYFSNYLLHKSDLEIDIKNNKLVVLQENAEPWKVTLIDTGEDSMTGGRLKRVSKYLLNEDAFCFTYGDGLSNINIHDLIKFHFSHGKLATVTAVNPPSRYGSIKIDSAANVTSFNEKPIGSSGLINGGFFVLSPKTIDLIENDSAVWERGPLEKLTSLNQLKAFQHEGFWHSLDTLRDKNYLEELWESGNAPWKLW